MILVRPLRDGDAAALGRFYDRLDARALGYRFGRTLTALPTSERDRLVHVDATRDIVLVAAPSCAGADEIVGEVRAKRGHAADDLDAEFAIVVRPDWQRRGVGAALLATLVDVCRDSGIRLLYGLVDASNGAMLSLAHRLGFQAEHAPGSSMVVVSLVLAGG